MPTLDLHSFIIFHIINIIISVNHVMVY